MEVVTPKPPGSNMIEAYSCLVMVICKSEQISRHLFSVSTVLGCSGLFASLLKFAMLQSLPWQKKGAGRIMSPLSHASAWKGHRPFLLIFHWPKSVIWP